METLFKIQILNSLEEIKEFVLKEINLEFDLAFKIKLEINLEIDMVFGNDFWNQFENRISVDIWKFKFTMGIYKGKGNLF